MLSVILISIPHAFSKPNAQGLLKVLKVAVPAVFYGLLLVGTQQSSPYISMAYLDILGSLLSIRWR
jgi:hypothetical protein